MKPIFTNDWADILHPEMQKPYYTELRHKLADEYRTKTVYPDMYKIFSAFHLTSFADTRVVILGQDPYHGPNQAHGLSFSVQPGSAVPPSLENIYRELHDDLGCASVRHGFLEHWAKQGVLLLNNVLTVRRGQPASHQGLGWEGFTDAAIAAVNERDTPAVFILWGRSAQEKGSFIDGGRHLVIKSAHPSPRSADRGFFGSRPFSRTNEFLRSKGLDGIDWCLPEIPAGKEEETP
ncbi:uracil-DNA glycosylase [Saccharibacillus sp. CPCC 101409]|uniref:uracil-DNA glycosylase n=1 Tax=Saccharibacillus sp. CPCC 101409 TaxID=3058041 RepID=UPI002672B357|nr:uracil-DNA glycosylase [Saccharibacillus sp. CPCC 101409]MDO3410770.1 uracil-DNA glycosylase [Saccharibacillus sp. CPCC 101409]